MLGLLVSVSAFGSPDTNQPASIYTKRPWAVGFGMKGTVTNVARVDGRIHFRLTGWFWFHQYPWGGTNRQVIKVDCERGISATVTPDSFVAMTRDWRAGSVQNDQDRLLQILQTAADRGTVVELALTQPRIDFGTNAFGFALLDAKVWRITDADLR
jgi:hypothetical protein